MRRVIFISLIIVAAVALFPGYGATAKTISPEQPISSYEGPKTGMFMPKADPFDSTYSTKPTYRFFNGMGTQNTNNDGVGGTRPILTQTKAAADRFRSPPSLHSPFPEYKSGEIGGKTPCSRGKMN